MSNEVLEDGGAAGQIESTRPRYVPQASVMGIVQLTEEEVEEIMENFAEEDDNSDKTWTRRIVENYLSKYKWYFPRRDMKDGPSLSKAYAYYEHVTLPRCFVGEQQAEHVQRRAEPGEKGQDTELYHPFNTKASSLIEWGIGVDLYFSSLRIMAAVLLIAGLINIHNLLFYYGTDYSPNGQGDLFVTLKGSAVCTAPVWVACSDCTRDNFTSAEEAHRFGIASDGTALVIRNGCNGGQLVEGMVNFATLFFVLGAISLISYYLHAREIRFDEDKITSTDYSVVVKNPPPKAYNPDDWRDFFEQFAEKQVTVVTIALNNERLVRKLIRRRINKNNLRRLLPKGTDMEDEDVVRAAVAQLEQEMRSEPKGCVMGCLDCCIFPILRIFGMFLKPQALVDNVFDLTEEIKELQTKKYTVTQVYVTFETENGQRAAMEALSASRIDIMTNNHRNSAQSAIFQGRVLKVAEPPEPSAVRWLDLSTPKCSRFVWRIFNLVLTLGLIGLCAYLIDLTRKSRGTFFSGPLTAIFNAVIPEFIKILTTVFERHDTEGGWQTSLYLKITLFRWVNTAVVPLLITPFTSTVSSEAAAVLPTMNAILLSELFLTPTIRLLDVMGNIKKHILAPRLAINQETCNEFFQGTYYNLGERYTDFTKVLFVCFVYSALFPSGFFFGAAILFIQYYADKYCLMRIWGWNPLIGPELAKFSRRFFYTGSVLAFALVSAYTWAQFPFDNLCDPTTPQPGYGGIYENVTFLNGTSSQTVNVTQDEAVVFCNQFWLENDAFPYPPTPRIQPPDAKWMNDSQEMLTNIYGWTSVLILGGFLVAFCSAVVANYFKSWFRGVYEPKGQSQQIDFCSNSEIFAYVPQIKMIDFPFPFLACDIDQIDQGLVGWSDPSHPYDYHNLIFDVPYAGMPKGNNRLGGYDNVQNEEQEEYQQQAQGESSGSADPIFSIIKHYRTPWQLRLMKQQQRSRR